MVAEILNFWFEEIDAKQWWQKDPDFDALIQKRFGELHKSASQCNLSHWRTTAQGCLAEIIILDQFSRNIYRDTAKAFESDSLALALAQCAIAQGQDRLLPPQMRSFMYLPYMHSESKTVHVQAVELYKALGNEDNLSFELKHKSIIDRFGRYPHRNAILGRTSTPEELEFLEGPNSSF
ncbi:membrane protein [Pseudoalteromonas sp. A25]|uniref:DUF924 family protein n=1 Tax=Pseudoalteromonas sp. A25 TaxID=116092 RepID=UPI0012604F0E|nr:DUF924 family protein [Pseudoalteromonas sp. A25]BBN81719.1 membrane protein [Pseudoalteromonas sp. A25]